MFILLLLLCILGVWTIRTFILLCSVTFSSFGVALFALTIALLIKGEATPIEIAGAVFATVFCLLAGAVFFYLFFRKKNRPETAVTTQEDSK